MSDGEISEDKAEQIEAAVNKITKSKFKAKIELRYFTEEEYNDALDKAFKDTEDAREAKKKAEAALKEAIKKVRDAGSSLIKGGVDPEVIRVTVAKHNDGDTNPSTIRDISVCDAILNEFEKLKK